MENDILQKTRETAALYFDGVSGERPYELWQAFDKELARDLSLFITGRMYAREKLPHPVRQLVAISALTALSRTEELALHVHAALNVGCSPESIAETMFQTAVYAGVPATNAALKVLRGVLRERGQWPPANTTADTRTPNPNERKG